MEHKSNELKQNCKHIAPTAKKGILNLISLVLNLKIYHKHFFPIYFASINTVLLWDFLLFRAAYIAVRI